MKNYIFIILLFFLTACTSNQQNQTSIDLFNGSTFELMDNEKEIDMTLHIKESYLDIIKNKNLQIPLFKIIKGSNYHVFIGLPVNTTMKEMFEKQLFDDSIRLHSKTDTSSYDYREYKKEENYISEYTSDKGGNLIYILTVTESKNISDSLLNYKNLSNRLHLKN